jgi:Leucine-rich repeat (LRR) protein
MDISDLIKKPSLSSIASVKRINPSAYWDDVKLEDVLTYSELDWLKNNFTNFSLRNYSSLVDLDLTGVPCIDICDDFFESKSLQNISKLGGKLKLNKSFCSLINLKKLKLLAVHVTSLPKNFGNLTNLEVLNLSDTSIKKLPKSISNLTKLREITIYKKLNDIEVEFPNSLEKIDFRANKLIDIPKNLFSLPKLKHLDISSNPFIDISVAKNDILETLMISDTPFGIFKSNLEKIKPYLKNCDITGGRWGRFVDVENTTEYLATNKKYYSKKYPNGHHSSH